MRTLLALLVGLNLVYLGWNLYARHTETASPAASVTPLEDAPRLALLIEAEPGELRERSGAAAASIAEGSAPSLGFLQPVAPLAPIAAGVQTTPASSGPDQAALASEPADLDGLTTHLAPSLSDSVAELLVDAMREPVVKAAASGPSRTERYCYSVGPLDTPAEIEAVGLWLDARAGHKDLREDERRELALYWIYFQPFASREEALERVARLRGQGLGDIYIIPRGDMANAISLGVYSRRESLERRLNQLRARGYEPAVAPRYKTRKAAWFDVRFATDIDFQSSGFAETFPAVEMSPSPCRVAVVDDGARLLPQPNLDLPGPRPDADGSARTPGAPAQAVDGSPRVDAGAAEPYDRARGERGFVFSRPTSGRSPAAAEE